MAKEQKSGGGSSRQVRDVMTKNPQTVTSKDNIVAAARIMRDSDTGVVPVVENKKIIGLITDRDIVVRMVAESRSANDVNVSELMSKSVRTVREDTPVNDVLTLMSSASVRRVPVVNSSDELVGIVSMGDIAKENKDGKVGQAVENISEAPPNN